jgi:hypothetical protein
MIGSERFPGCRGAWLLLFLLLVCAPPGNAEIRDIQRIYSEENTSGWALGPTFKIKRVSGPIGFGGDMLVWGMRAMGGKANASKLGLTAGKGTLHGNSLKMNLAMGGISLEDSFPRDSHLFWRVTVGGGSYDVRSRYSDYIFNRGSFVYCEPMVMGRIKITRHLALELGGGYTITNTIGARIEGPCVQGELLIGRF